MSQWKFYLNFSSDYGLDPLPAEIDTILLYIAFLAESKAYVSIINYLSAVWTLHKLNGIPHLDPSSFPITMTLRGIRRSLGDARKQARPVTVDELRLVFNSLDMENYEDVAFWLALVLCFRSLLRKSNVVEKELAVLVSDVEMFNWGVILSIRRSKTIGFKERILLLPFNKLDGSIFCIYRVYCLLRSLVFFPSPYTQLISYVKKGKLVRGSYTWLMRRLTSKSHELKMTGLSTHSLRRGGASALGNAGFDLLQIKDLGDWASLAVLQYISRSMDARREMDRDMCAALFC